MIITFMQSLMERLRHNEEGQTAVEYALVLALISLVIVGAIALGLGTVATDALGKVTDALAAL